MKMLIQFYSQFLDIFDQLNFEFLEKFDRYGTCRVRPMLLSR
jgi:hypothetical protein